MKAPIILLGLMLELKTQSQPVYGEIYSIPSKVFKLQKQIIKLQKKLSRQKKDGKNYQRTRKRLRKKHGKIHNIHRIISCTISLQKL